MSKALPDIPMPQRRLTPPGIAPSRTTEQAQPATQDSLLPASPTENVATAPQQVKPGDMQSFLARQLYIVANARHKARTGKDGEKYTMVDAQDIAGALHEILNRQNWRIYPQPMQCATCETALDEEATRRAARATTSRRKAMNAIFAAEAEKAGEKAHRDAIRVIDAYEIMLEALSDVCEVFAIWEAEDTMQWDTGDLCSRVYDAHQFGISALHAPKEDKH